MECSLGTRVLRLQRSNIFLAINIYPKRSEAGATGMHSNQVQIPTTIHALFFFRLSVHGYGP